MQSLMQQKFTTETIAEAFNKAQKEYNEEKDEKNKKKKEDDVRYLKTLITDAIAIFASHNARSYPPESMIADLLKLAKAEDEEIYRQCLSALSGLLTNTGSVLTNFNALQSLVYLIRYPVKTNYVLSHEEMDRLLNLVLSHLGENALLLEQLVKLLDAMVDRQSLIANYKKKKDIRGELEKLAHSSDQAVKFQAKVALKTLESIGINESKREEWQRRALAFSSAVESLLKIGSDISGAVATFGATAIFIIPGVLKEARNAVQGLSVALDIKIKENEWYAKIKDIQISLALAAVEVANPAADDLTTNDILKLFTQLRKAIDAPSSVRYAIVSSLQQILLLRANETVLRGAFDLLVTYYRAVTKNEIINNKLHGTSNEAIRTKILEQLLITTQSAQPLGKTLTQSYQKLIAEGDRKFYAESLKNATANVAKMTSSKQVQSVGTIPILMAEAQNRINHLLEVKEDTSEVVIPLIGENAVVNAKIDVKQIYEGYKFKGNIKDVLQAVHDEIFRRILEADAEAARKVITKQVVARNAQVNEPIFLDQKAVAPSVDLREGITADDKPTAIAKPTLSLSADFKKLISETLENFKKSNKHFKLSRLDANSLKITFVNNGKLTIADITKISGIRINLETALKEAKLVATFALNEDEDELTIKADRKVVNVIVNALYVQGVGNTGSSEIEQQSFFFKGKEKAASTRKAPEEEIEQIHEVTCSIQ